LDLLKINNTKNLSGNLGDLLQSAGARRTFGAPAFKTNCWGKSWITVIGPSFFRDLVTVLAHLL